MLADVNVGATWCSLIAFVADLFLFHGGGILPPAEPEQGGGKRLRGLCTLQGDAKFDQINTRGEKKAFPNGPEG